MRLRRGNLYLVGDDSPGDVFWIQHGNRTRVGTLFAVYELLEKQLGVRWLWPGPLGEVVPHGRRPSGCRSPTRSCTPPFIHTRWREGGATWPGRRAGPIQKNRSSFLNEQGKWLRRHRFAMGINMDMAHSFTDWWDRFGKEHPEYFNLLPDGTRRSDPTYYGGDQTLISMSRGRAGRCGGRRWRTGRRSARRRRRTSMPARTTPPASASARSAWPWTSPTRQSSAVRPARRRRRRRLFAAGKQTGSSRWARCPTAMPASTWRCRRKREKIDPQAVVMGYAYANYVKPPLQTKLNQRIIIGIVPALMYPWTAEKRKDFIEQWNGWSAAGARLLLRPNYMLDGHSLPINFAQPLGEDFSFAVKHGLDRHGLRLA